MEQPRPSARPRFLADGGLETVLIFGHGIDLPCFAAFDLLRRDGGEALLRSYYEPYLAIGRDDGVGFLLDTPTWRANADWGTCLGYDHTALESANRHAVALIEGVRRDHLTGEREILLQGVVGPRREGCEPVDRMTAGEAAEYHAAQVRTFADTPIDLVAGVTIGYVEEAIGIARAARAVGLQSVISFTVETDGRLPSGEPLGAAIRRVDDATDGTPTSFMVNCAHPTHLLPALACDEAWKARLTGFRANGSPASHAELDAADELAEGDPDEVARGVGEVAARLPSLTVAGGCCGTDARHVAAIWRNLSRSGRD